jgi:hypothetical protein
MITTNSLPLLSPVPKDIFINPDEIILIEFEGFRFLYEGKYCINDSVFFQYKKINYMFCYDWDEVSRHADVNREDLVSYHLQDYIAANSPDWIPQCKWDEYAWEHFDDKWEVFTSKLLNETK